MPQATEQAQNDRDEQIATMDRPLRKTRPRFCSIAWFAPHKASRHNCGKNPRRILTRPTPTPTTLHADPQPFTLPFARSTDGHSFVTEGSLPRPRAARTPLQERRTD